jgi:hypothetical protein
MVKFCGYDVSVFYIVLNAVPFVIICPEKFFPCMDAGKRLFYMLSMISAGVE